MNNDDRLSKFIKAKGDIDSAGYMKRRVMGPRSDGKSSVFVTTTLDENGVWRHAAEYYRSDTIGRGDLTVNDMDEVSRKWSQAAGNTATALVAIMDEPPPLHANITGFAEDKEEQMAVAQLLVEKCGKAILKPETS